MRIIQFRARNGDRRVGLVLGQSLATVRGVSTTLELVNKAILAGTPIDEYVDGHLSDERHEYAAALLEGRVLTPIDHVDPARLWVTGTGLTHLGSAKPRDEMHAQAPGDTGSTDTMRMFEMGIRGGKPDPGDIGVQPEWFYKGNGTCVVPPGGTLSSPSFALLDGDEIEVCVLYFISERGVPLRIGFALGNEFADHVLEKENYLYLAHSKLRPCSFGPELLLGPLPDEVAGTSRILRDGEVVWSKPFLSGERHMSHSLANLEYHLFKYPLFRRPGDLHSHFLGTATVSFSDGFEPRSGDVFEMEAECFGAPLRNTLTKESAASISVEPLYRE